MQILTFIQKHRGGIVLLLLLLPLCFVAVRQNHDWGDDFAQYINQAKCIVEGKTASQTGYIYNSNYPMLGPAAYPAGFPLLLSPVYALFGNSIVVFNAYMSLWLVLAGFIWYMVLRRFHNELTSVLISLLWCWHPWVLDFKSEIMADIPFTALTGLLILMHQRGFLQYDEQNRKKSLLQAVAMGLIAGLLLAVKMQGLAVIAAIFAVRVINNIIDLQPPFEPKNKLYTNPATVLIVGFLTCFVIINYLVAGITFDDLFTYGSNFAGEPFWVSVRENLAYYTVLVQDFFQRSKPTWQVFPMLTQALVLAFCIIGLVQQLAKNRPTILWVFLAYMALLLVYPYRGSGFRFLLPVAPILLHFAVVGFKSIQWGFTLNKKIWAVGGFVLVLLQFLPEQHQSIKNAKNNFAGPQEAESVEAFAYIQNNTPANAVFMFKKPRALALYTQRNAFAVNSADSAFVNDIERFAPNYILIHTELSPESEKQYVVHNAQLWQPQWHNNKFTLYAKNTQ